jgi:hypothetical protein
MWSQKPPETVSEIVNIKFFLGEHPPRPPYFENGAARENFPRLRKKKSCTNPCLLSLGLVVPMGSRQAGIAYDLKLLSMSFGVPGYAGL